jgi:beta-lactam-binding protein with PASTA domain
VPLLDGKYEIHDERALAGGVTSFAATAPDGEPVRVEWLDLEPDDEAAFERYRRLLKRLAREGRAAVQDVVARPGARYVAWYVPPEGSHVAHDATLDAAVTEAGFDPATAEVRRLDGVPRLVALPFRPPPVAATAPAAPSASARPIRPRLPALTPTLRTWSLATALALAGAALALGGFQRRANDRVVVMPELLGASYEVAAATLQRLGLHAVPQPIASDLDEAGVVLATDPAAGQTLRPGREVRLSVALPAGQLAPTDVPRLVGLASVDSAIGYLERAGLALGRIVRIHVDAPDGVVLAQAPPAGSRAGRGAAVDVVVSLGPKPRLTFLPDLVGLSLDEARALAAIAGLAPSQVVVERLPSEQATLDTVLAQSLAPFRDVVLTDAVLRLIVADVPAARDPLGLPALGGLSEARARELAAGFDLEVVYVGERALPDGVVAQSLPVGARPTDGRLSLTVNARPLPIPQPPVDVVVRAPARRDLPYLWAIEPGIPLVVAVVTATTLEGDQIVIDRREVRGGERVEGAWSTTYPGVVRFDLTLNGEPYGGSLRAP